MYLTIHLVRKSHPPVNNEVYLGARRRGPCILYGLYAKAKTYLTLLGWFAPLVNVNSATLSAAGFLSVVCVFPSQWLPTSYYRVSEERHALWPSA